MVPTTAKQMGLASAQRVLVLMFVLLDTTSARRISFNFDTGPVFVHTNCSCGRYTFHESWRDGVDQVPTYTITSEDVNHVAEEFRALTTENILAGEGRDENFVFVKFALNKTNQQQTLVDFAAVLPSQEGTFKFLPFKMEDMKSILTMTKLPRGKEYPEIEIPINQASDKQLAQWFQAKNTSTIKAQDLGEERQNLLITMLFFAISFNPKIDADEKYQICVAKKDRNDVPFVLER